MSAKKKIFPWNHIFNQKLFSNLSLVYSDFDYGFGVEFAENASFGFDQDIEDLYIKPDFTYFFNTKSTLNFGGQLIHHNFNPGTFTSTQSVQQIEERRALEGAVYVDHQYDFSQRFNVRYGLRYSGFTNLGGTAFEYSKDENYKPIDSFH